MSFNKRPDSVPHVKIDLLSGKTQGNSDMCTPITMRDVNKQKSSETELESDQNLNVTFENEDFTDEYKRKATKYKNIMNYLNSSDSEKSLTDVSDNDNHGDI